MSSVLSSAFPAASAGSCSQPASPSPVPALISNAAGRNAIQYRIGDFTSFRAAMLAAVPDPNLLLSGATSLQSALSPTDTVISVLDSGPFPATAPFRIRIDSEYLLVINCLSPNRWAVARDASATSHEVNTFVSLVPPNPFASWHPGIDGDYQTVFVELWAYLADILTFYQERIANESYLGTATLRDSLLRLAGLIDYRPGPGAAAGGWVSFTAAVSQSQVIPAAFRIASRAQRGQAPVVFETSAAAVVTGDNNSISLAPLSPVIPFAPGTVVLQGTNPGVTTGDYLAIFDGIGTTSGSSNLVLVTGVIASAALSTTTVNWRDPNGLYLQASKNALVYAFRVQATPFGYNAPVWDILSPTLTNSNNQFSRVIYPISWETPLWQNVFNDWFFIPVPGERTDQLFVDRSYSQLKYNGSETGVAALVNGDGVFQILNVIDARETAKTAYSFAGQSTRLTFDQPIAAQTFPLRSTVVLTGNELLPLQLDLPVPDPVTGSTLTLAGLHTQLQDAQTVVLRGTLFGTAPASTSGTVAAEAAVINGAPQIDAFNQVTIINLKQGLAHQYVLATCALLANVVAITQGATVSNEILGSGDGTAFQNYALKKTPLTYLPSTDPDGLSAVQSTLSVNVNGVLWTEQPNLAASAAADPVFVTTLDDAGQTTVFFGDGFNGARPTTGVNNIQARYRQGLGSIGNLAAGGVQQMVDSLTGVQKVVNPIAISGGADPESPSSIRRNAPGALQTFGRAVSAADYAALASSYPGVAKASAAWVVQDPATQKTALHPYVQVTAAALNHAPLTGTSLAGNLRRFLDGHRDPNVLLRIQDFAPVYLAVAVEVSINPKFPSQATLNAVSAALNPGVNPDGSLGFFAFDRLQFGQNIYLSALYAAIQAVAGIDTAVVTTLARVAPAPADPISALPHDIFIGPTEVAVIDGSIPASSLTVTGKGGFADS